MIDFESCYSRVCDVLRDCCGVSAATSLSPQASLQGDLALDSIALLNLLGELEDTYGFRLDNPFEEPPGTVGGVVELVLKLNGGNHDA